MGADRFWLLAVALALDALFGDPEALWRRIPHPVVLFGAAIGAIDRALNGDRLPTRVRRTRGAASIAAIVIVAVLAGTILEAAFAALGFGWIGIVVVASILLAGRSLADHAAAVGAALAHGVDAGRTAVARIVGRDPSSLDAAGVARAAIESTAENFSDGVVAPAFWFLLFGLPGLFAYKAINTADSMIGHRNERYRDFGWAAARLDDVVNWPAARIAALLIALAAPFAKGSFRDAIAAARADAGNHRSPNAGWPEAAMAGALGLALAGPRRYGGEVVNDRFLNGTGRHDATPADIGRALAV